MMKNMKNNNEENLDILMSKVGQWSADRGLDKADPTKQMLKLFEEIGELAHGMARSDKDKIIDAIGDSLVVIKVLTMQLDLDITECLQLAYNEIKDRKGKMVNGVFVKEEDLSKLKSPFPIKTVAGHTFEQHPKGTVAKKVYKKDDGTFGIKEIKYDSKP